jgi:plasmid replication initiation protein
MLKSYYAKLKFHLEEQREGWNAFPKYKVFVYYKRVIIKQKIKLVNQKTRLSRFRTTNNIETGIE